MKGWWGQGKNGYPPLTGDATVQGKQNQKIHTKSIIRFINSVSVHKKQGYLITYWWSLSDWSVNGNKLSSGNHDTDNYTRETIMNITPFDILGRYSEPTLTTLSLR